MGGGFKTFGSAHLGWLLSLGGLIGLTLKLFRGKELTGTRAYAAAAFFPLVTRWLLCGSYLQLGWYDLSTLPLHVCGMASYACAVHGFSVNRSAARDRGREILDQILFFPMLPGAGAALLFPGWTWCEPLSPLSILEFLGHASIVLYILLALQCGTILPDRRRARIPIAFLVIYAVVIGGFDLVSGMNYGFLCVPSEASPLSLIGGAASGEIGYLFGYAVLMLLLLAASYWIYGVCCGTRQEDRGIKDRKDGRD